MAEEHSIEDPTATIQLILAQPARVPDHPAEWAMEPYDVPPENVAFLQSILAAEMEPSAIPIRKLPVQ